MVVMDVLPGRQGYEENHWRSALASFGMVGQVIYDFKHKQGFFRLAIYLPLLSDLHSEIARAT
jgi:hypothetical protein